MGIENTGNNSGYDLNIIDSFRVIRNLIGNGPSSTCDKSVITPGLRSPERVVETGLYGTP